MLSFLLLAAAAAASPMTVPPGEGPVKPYVQSNANAGAAPFKGKAMWYAFHEQAGVNRIVDDLVDRNIHDPVIGEIFVGQDIARLRRVLKEQFCYILGGGCAYTGRSMKDAHTDMGVQMKDMNVMVGNLQKAMTDERVPFFAQNRLLAKFAPMRRDIVTH